MHLPMPYSTTAAAAAAAAASAAATATTSQCRVELQFQDAPCQQHTVAHLRNLDRLPKDRVHRTQQSLAIRIVAFHCRNLREVRIELGAQNVKVLHQHPSSVIKSQQPILELLFTFLLALLALPLQAFYQE